MSKFQVVKKGPAQEMIFPLPCLINPALHLRFCPAHTELPRQENVSPAVRQGNHSKTGDEHSFFSRV